MTVDVINGSRDAHLLQGASTGADNNLRAVGHKMPTENICRRPPPLFFGAAPGVGTINRPIQRRSEGVRRPGRTAILPPAPKKS